MEVEGERSPSSKTGGSHWEPQECGLREQKDLGEGSLSEQGQGTILHKELNLNFPVGSEVLWNIRLDLKKKKKKTVSSIFFQNSGCV